MSARVTLTKQTANGESLTVEIPTWNPVTGEVELDNVQAVELANLYLDAFDERLYQMNMRMLEAYKLKDYFPSEWWQRTVAILDIIAGRQTADVVARRWQSEVEETRELEEMRLAAYNGRP